LCSFSKLSESILSTQSATLILRCVFRILKWQSGFGTSDISVRFGAFEKGNCRISPISFAIPACLMSALSSTFENSRTAEWVIHKIIRTDYFNTLYHASFIILYSDQQMHTITSQIVTLLHVSTLSCHPQTACKQCLATLHRYFKCSCW
jgi:hypothetical protein